MERIENKAFGPIRLDVGGKRFVDCDFTGTTLVYSGGKAPSFSGKCAFEGTKFDFVGEGWEAFAYLRILRAIGGPDFIEVLLDVPNKKGGGTAH